MLMTEEVAPRIIRDEDGNPMTLAEYESCIEEARRIMDAFFSELNWQPIAQYYKAGGDIVLLGNGTDWALGFWGEKPRFSSALDADPIAPSWRHAQDFRFGVSLEFAPTEFAFVDEEWNQKLQAH